MPSQEELKASMRDKTDEGLHLLLNVHSQDYTPEAINAAKEEFSRRQLDKQVVDLNASVPNQSPQVQLKTVKRPLISRDEWVVCSILSLGAIQRGGGGGNFPEIAASLLGAFMGSLLLVKGIKGIYAKGGLIYRRIVSVNGLRLSGFWREKPALQNTTEQTTEDRGKKVNLKEGTRRLALLLGVAGAMLGGVVSYAQLQSLMRQRANHRQFERLADSDAVKQAKPDWFTQNAPMADPWRKYEITEPDGTPLASEVNNGGIKTIHWAKDYGVKSIETEDGRTLYSMPAPGAGAYLLIAILPLLGFFVPWGGVRAIGWVGSGFVTSPK